MAGFARTHAQLGGVLLRRTGRDHQLLVRGDPEGGEAFLHGPAAEGQAVVLYPLQQLQPERQPAGAVHLGDGGGEVPHEEVPHRHLLLLRASRRHER